MPKLQKNNEYKNKLEVAPKSPKGTLIQNLLKYILGDFYFLFLISKIMLSGIFLTLSKILSKWS